MDNDTMTVDTGSYDDPVTPWTDPRWRRAALAWAEEGLAARGLRAGPRREWEARLRPWSVVVRIPVVNGPDIGPGGPGGQGGPGGPGGQGGPGAQDVAGAQGGPAAQDGPGAVVWFKANPPGSAFEPALVRALADWVPDHVLQPLAVDTERAWSLLPDGGPLLDDDWEGPLRQYAALQRELGLRAGELAALGLPDHRPGSLVAHFDALADLTGAPQDVRRVRPRLADWCAELADSGIPDTLDHSDLHEAQVFQGESANGGTRRYVFFDWGDASLAHPFTSLLVTARVARERHGADSPAVLARLRDAYLEPWTGGRHELPELRRVASLACRVGPVARALTWNRLFPGSAARPQTAHHENIARWLAELLNEPLL